MRWLAPLLCLLLTCPAWADGGDDLKRATAKQDAAAVAAACKQLQAQGGRKALDAVVQVIAKTHRIGQDDVYWALVQGAAGFGDEPALRALGKELAGNKHPWARDVVFALGSSASPLRIHALAPVLAKGPLDLRLLAGALLAALHTDEAKQLLAKPLRKDRDLARWLSPPAKLAPAPGQVLVVSGKLPKDHPKLPGEDLDRSHLEALLADVPHTVVSKPAFEKEAARYLKRARCVIVNDAYVEKLCACKTCAKRNAVRRAKGQTVRGCPPDCSLHELMTIRLTLETIRRVQRWVERERGTLITCGWGAIEVLEPAWPKRVRVPRYGDADERKPMLVSEVELALHLGRGQASRPLLRGVGGAVSWKVKLPDRTPAVAPAPGATPLLVSDKLKALAGETALALTFRAGKAKPKQKLKTKAKGAWNPNARGGRVVHLVAAPGKAGPLRRVFDNAVREALSAK